MKSEDMAIGIPATILLIAHILLCVYLLTIILLKRTLRDQVNHWFILNAVIAHLLFSLIVRPGTIEYEFHHVGTAQVYCRLYFILGHVEQVMVPALILMYTVDRMMYVRNPDTYGQKMSMGVVLVLLLLPWALSILVGLISAYGYSGAEMISSLTDNSNSTPVACVYREYSMFHTGMQIFEALLALLVALVSLIVTVLVICFFFRYKRALSFSQAYSQLETEVMHYVKDATIIVCLINLLFLLVFLMNFLIAEFAHFWIDHHGIYFLFELFQAVLFLFLSTDIRHESYKMCCKRNVADNEPSEETTLRYSVNTAEEAQ